MYLGDDISYDSPISPIEAMSGYDSTLSVSSVSSDSTCYLLPGITIFLNICFIFHIAIFGNDLTLVCATSDLYSL